MHAIREMKILITSLTIIKAVPDREAIIYGVRPGAKYGTEETNEIYRYAGRYVEDLQEVFQKGVGNGSRI